MKSALFTAAIIACYASDTNASNSAEREACSKKQYAAEQYACYYDLEVHDFSSATRFGFAAPAPVFSDGSGVVMAFPGGLDFDWSKPIGFAVIDCDLKATMLDGKTKPFAVEISWDLKRSCLRVMPARRR